MKKKKIAFYFLLLLLAVLPAFLSGNVFFRVQLGKITELLAGGTARMFFFVIIIFTMAFALTPTTFVAVLAGYFFSWSYFPLLIVSYMSAAVTGLWAGRRLNKTGWRIVPATLKGKVAELFSRVEQRPFPVIFFARLSPALPFAMTNVLLSSFRVSWKNYLLGSLLGMLPRTFLSFWTGRSIPDMVLFIREPTVEESYRLVPVALLVISFLGLYLALKKGKAPQ